MAIPHSFISMIVVFLSSFLFLCQISNARPECARVYGAGIDYADCLSALALFDTKVRVEIAGGNPATTFILSRDPNIATGMRRMRQTISHRTCSIGLDMTDPLPVTGGSMSSWRTFKTHIMLTLRNCVTRPGAIGGVYKFGAFEVTIMNPQLEAVRNILAMRQTSRLSLSTSIKTETMDLKLKQDAETGPGSPQGSDASSPRGSHSRPHVALPYPPLPLAPNTLSPAERPPSPAPNMPQPALQPPPRAPYPFPQAPTQARPNVAHGVFNPSEAAHLATLNPALLRNLQLHGNISSAQNQVPPPLNRPAAPFQGQSQVTPSLDRPAAPFQGQNRAQRPPFQWRAPSLKSNGAPVMEHYRSRQSLPMDQAFGGSVL